MVERISDESVPGELRAADPAGRGRHLLLTQGYRNGLLPVVCVGSAILCLSLSNIQPTGRPAADVIFRAGFGALMAAFSARADWRALLIASAAAAIFSATGLGTVCGLVAFGIAVAVTDVDPAHSRQVGQVGAAVAGGLAATSLTSLSDFGVSRLSTVIAVGACLPVVVSGYRGTSASTRKLVRRVGAVVAAVVLASGVALAVAGLSARSAANQASKLSSEGLELARSGDSAGAVEKFSGARPLFAGARDELESPWLLPARLVPGVAQNTDAATRMVSAGEEVATGATRTLNQADYRKVHIDQGQVDLRSLTALVGPTVELNEALRRGVTTIDGADTTWLIPQVSSPLDEVRASLAGASEEGNTAEQALRVAPALLGAEGERRYFIAFTNPAEARSLGGFIGNFGILHCKDGKVTLETDGSIDELTFSPESRSMADPRLAEFARAQSVWMPTHYFQNLTATPDPTTSALAIAELYPQTAKGQAIDGVLTIDPYGLAALMDLTGPITVDGIDEQLTEENAADYLIKGQYELFESRSLRTQRKDLLEAAAHATFDALTNRRLPGPAAIGRALGPAVRGGRIRFVAFAPEEGALVTRIGLNKSFGAIEGRDVLSLRTANSGGNKLDAYLQRELTYDVTVDAASGQVSATVTARLTNGAPEGLPDYVQSNGYAADGTNTQYVLVYTPFDLQEVRLDGEVVATGPGLELGLHSYTNRIHLARGQTRVLSYRLAGPLPAATPPSPTGHEYRLDVIHQPTVLADDVSIVVRDASGKVLHEEELELVEDRSLTVRTGS